MATTDFYSTPYTNSFGQLSKGHTPLVRFVVDSLYNVYNESTTNRTSGIWP